MYVLSNRAMTRTAFLPPGAGVGTAASAVTWPTKVMVGAAKVNWLTPNYLRSRPTAKTWPALGVLSVVIDIAIPMMERTTVLLRTMTPNIARMMLSGRHDASVVR